MSCQKIIPNTVTEIKITIHSLKSKNSSGYDEIMGKILKSHSASISCPAAQISKHSLYTHALSGPS
jgi:hypothetical protein